MKSLVFFGIIYVLLLPLLAIACDKAKPIEPIPTPTTQGNIVNLDLGDFSISKNITRDVELTNPGSFTLQLGSNASTGYDWGDAAISAPNIISLASKDVVAPKDTKLAGAAGADVWVFKAVKAGSATIKLSYGQPWTGGEKDAYTLTINVTVK